MSTEKNLPTDPDPSDSNIRPADWLANEGGGPASGELPEMDDVFSFGEDDLAQGPPSFAGKSPATEDVEISWRDLPPISPTKPASGWLDSNPKLGQSVPTQPASPSPESSDILSGAFPNSHAESDVIGNLVGNGAPASSSSIFDAPPAGSSRFANPTEPTEDHLDQPEQPGMDQLFDTLGQANQPSSNFSTDGTELNAPVDTPPPVKPDISAGPAEAFNLVEGTPGEALDDWFTEANPDDAPNEFLDSGINLGNPLQTGDDPISGPSSSIFNDEEILPRVDEIVANELSEMVKASDNEAIDVLGFNPEQEDNNSSIFEGKPKPGSDPESVFDEGISAEDPLSKAANEAGMIDWHLPEQTGVEQLSQRMPIQEETSLDELEASTDDLLAAAAKQLSGRLEPDSHETDWNALASDLAEALNEPTGSPLEPSEDLTSTPLPPKPLVETAGLPFQAYAQPANPKTATSKRPPSTVSSAELDLGQDLYGSPLDPASQKWPKAPEEKRKGALVGWLAGSALGVLVGVGGTGAAFLSGAFSADPVAPQAILQVPPPGPSGGEPPAAVVEDPRALLAAGEPARALALLEAAGENASLVTQADRGQARWLTRLRELAGTPGKLASDDPQFLKAEQELQAVFQAADQLQTAEERQAGVRAALHLGLLKEVGGDSAAAFKIYSDATVKFPDAGKVFKAALNRLKLTQGGASQQSRLKPGDAADLARAAVVLLTLATNQADPSGTPDTEPGFLFWDASNLATSGKYEEAIKQLAAARKLHETRRLTLAGKGTNPLSDPLEQIFSRTCDDLINYWKLKHELASHTKYGEQLTKQGIGPVLTQLDQQNQQLASEKNQAQQDVLMTKNLLAKTEEDRRQALRDLQRIQGDLKVAQDKVTLADLQVRKADETVNTILAELKRNKLLAEADDRTSMLEKLPAVLKQAALASSTSDAKKAAEALVQAKQERETALSEARAALAQAQKAQDQAKEAMSKLAKARDEADERLKAVKDSLDTEIKKAVAAAQQDSRKQLEELTAATAKAKEDLAAQQKAFQDRLAQEQRDFTRQLAAKEQELREKIQEREAEYVQTLSDARSGAVVPLSSAEIVARDRASVSYGRGMDFYFGNQLIAAEASFALAVSLDPTDARYWYFLALARTQLGRADAITAFRKGAEQERRSQPTSRSIDDALERIQGPIRQKLNSYRPR